MKKSLPRALQLKALLKKKSFFLFGPRSTGKSTLIRQTFPKAMRIDLLETQTFLRLTENPDALETFHPKGLFGPKEIIVIDEIQRVPALLEEVHRLIELRHCHFLMTGSSARKLKRGHANLLAGRAWTAELFPLVYREIPKFNLQRYLRYGGLPQVFLSAEPFEELNAYVNTYLKEEIQAEGLVRKLPAFIRFLKAAALMNGQLIRFDQIASDTGVSANTVRDHYSILVDTLLGFHLEPWRESKKRKAIATSKFYFFDIGVVHTLAGYETIDRNSNLYGTAFEHLIAQEILAYLSYSRKHLPMTFWRSQGGMEVDFLIGEKVAIEVKATTRVSEKHKKGLAALQEEKVFKKYFLVSQDPTGQTKDGIRAVFWQTFLEELWAGSIL